MGDNKNKNRSGRIIMMKNIINQIVTMYLILVESPSLEIFKTHLDKVLCSLL